MMMFQVGPQIDATVRCSVSVFPAFIVKLSIQSNIWPFQHYDVLISIKPKKMTFLLCFTDLVENFDEASKNEAN